jgi:hypothetical protein
METPSSNTALLARLARADSAWRREQARVLLWRALPGFAALLLVACAADAFLQLGVAPRLGFLVVALLAAAALGGVIAHRVWLRRHAPERVARHLETRAPALGSRLINALQLAAQTTDARLPALTRDLAAQAVGRYATELDATDLPGLARTGADRRALERSVLWLGGALVLGLVFYPVMEIVLPRFYDPFGDHPPYAFTRVEIAQPLADGTPVIYGGTLSVRVAWSGHEPRELFLTAHPPELPDEGVTVPMIRDGKDGFIADLSGVRTDLILVAHAKDRSYHSTQRLARVVLTPRLEAAWVEIVPPTYTALRTEERKLDFKTVGALQGSTLRFRLRSNRPLRSGLLEVRREGGVEASDAPELINLIPVAAPTPAAAGDSSRVYEVAGELLANTDARLRFHVTDIDGLVSVASPETLLTLAHDLAPLVEVREPAQDGFVSIGFTLPAKFEATDDYGIRTLRIHRALNGVYTAPLTVEIEGVQRDASRNLAFDFAALGARPGDSVSFFAEAIDTAPEPHLGRSRTVTVTLISEDEYNQHLRETLDIADIAQKYAALLERFEALRDAQQRLADEARALAEKLAAPDAPPDAAAEARLAELAPQQDALDGELDKLADELLTFVRPNPVYDFERDLAKRLTLESGALRDSAQRSREAGAASPPADPAERLAALEQRAREQAERLGARREQLAQDVERPLRDLARLHDLVNAFNLFEQAYLAQESLAEQMRAYATKPNPTREDQLAMKDLAARQAAVREVLRQLPGQLRERAAAAEGEFPKAAAAGRDMAELIEQARLGPLAQNATERLLQADGRDGAALTRRLADEMAALMSKCQGGEGESSDELDQYLQAQMPQAGGGRQTWEQMRQSRKFSLEGGAMPGLSSRPGSGGGPASGYSTSGNNPPPVFGAEPSPSPASGQLSSNLAAQGSGQGDGAGGGSPAVQTGEADVLKNINAADRESGATPGELGAEEYRELVEEYFKQLTRP